MSNKKLHGKADVLDRMYCKELIRDIHEYTSKASYNNSHVVYARRPKVANVLS